MEVVNIKELFICKNPPTWPFSHLFEPFCSNGQQPKQKRKGKEREGKEGEGRGGEGRGGEGREKRRGQGLPLLVS
jgi:hypothetical protein